MNYINIWGNAKKELETHISKNYVGYIPDDYENYGFKISAVRYICNSTSQDAEEPYELDNGGYSKFEIKITCCNSVKMWKFSYKLTNTDNVMENTYKLKYILKGSNDNSYWNTIHDSITIERIFTLAEMTKRPVPVRAIIKSIFPNILIENPKSYKYYSFIVTINIKRDRVPIDQISMAVTVSNFQLYIMNAV